MAGQGPACRDEHPDLAEQLPHTDGLLLRRTDPVLDILNHGGQSNSRINGRLLHLSRVKLSLGLIVLGNRGYVIWGRLLYLQIQGI